MRKNLLLSVMSLLSFLSMNAQFEKGDLTLSPQLGVNFTRYISPDATYNALTTISIGVAGDYYFSDRWSLKSGLTYYNMGAEDGYGTMDKLSYLSVPINASYHFGKRRNWYLNFGPTMHFLVNAESDFPDGSSIDIKNFVNSFDIGLGMGIGYTFNVSENFKMFVDYQGYLGFIDVAKSGLLPYSISNARDGFNVGAIFKL